MLSLLENGLATWRLSNMLVKEAGPNRVFETLRLRTGIEYRYDGEVLSYPDWNPLHCVYCTSVYTAVLLMIMPRVVRQALAMSGVAALLETCVGEGKVGR